METTSDGVIAQHSVHNSLPLLLMPTPPLEFDRSMTFFYIDISFFNASIQLPVIAGFAKKNRMYQMTYYSMTCVKMRGRIVMATAGFVTSVLA